MGNHSIPRISSTPIENRMNRMQDEPGDQSIKKIRKTVSKQQRSQSGFGINSTKQERYDRIQQTENQHQSKSDGEGFALLGHTRNQGTDISGNDQGERMQPEYASACQIHEKTECESPDDGGFSPILKTKERQPDQRQIKCYPANLKQRRQERLHQNNSEGDENVLKDLQDQSSQFYKVSITTNTVSSLEKSTAGRS